MAEKRASIKGNENDLISLANATAMVATMASSVRKVQAEANLLRAQADAKDAAAETEKLKFMAATSEMKAVKEKLGIPLDVNGYRTDFEAGVYSWEEPDNDSEHVAPAAGD